MTSTIVRPSRWNCAHAVEALAWNASSPTARTSSISRIVGVDVHGHREPEPHEHARGVELHLVVHEVLELGELDDVVEDPVGLLAGEPEERGVQVDVLAAGELGVESGAELEQRGDAPALADDARRRAQDAGDHLQQRGLARAVVPDQAERRALGDVERDVAQRPEVLGLRARRTAGAA